MNVCGQRCESGFLCVSHRNKDKAESLREEMAHVRVEMEEERRKASVAVRHAAEKMEVGHGPVGAVIWLLSCVCLSCLCSYSLSGPRD